MRVEYTNEMTEWKLAEKERKELGEMSDCEGWMNEWMSEDGKIAAPEKEENKILGIVPRLLYVVHHPPSRPRFKWAIKAMPAGQASCIWLGGPSGGAPE